MTLSVSFSRGRDDRDGPTIGPFTYGLQMTYLELRDCSTGLAIATFGEDGDWHIAPGYDPSPQPEPWSDIHITPTEDL